MLRLRYLRQERKLTQKQVADLLNVSQETYSRYENKVIKIPLNSLTVLAEFYETSTDYILGLTDERKPYKNVVSSKKNAF